MGRSNGRLWCCMPPQPHQRQWCTNPTAKHHFPIDSTINPMPFSAAARTSPCSWEPYLSNDVQNTNNNQPERRQPVKQKWVVVAKQLQMNL